MLQCHTLASNFLQLSVHLRSAQFGKEILDFSNVLCTEGKGSERLIGSRMLASCDNIISTKRFDMPL